MVLALLIAIGWGGAKSFGSATTRPRSPQASAVSQCRSDPHAGVHEPTRLKILRACATFVGTVVEAPKLHASDGDVTFKVAPEGADASMLNDMNRSRGGIHMEIIPMDQPGCTAGQPIKGPEANLGACTGAHVLFPPLGARVRVFGAHVYDSWVGWNEIHPVWKVEILPPTGPPPPEARQLKARLNGKAVGKHGARRGFGRVALTLTDGKVCWSFTRLARIGRPTRATIRAGAPGRTGAVVVALGRRYSARGCSTAAAVRLQPVEERPQLYYVLVVTARHRFGAIRGQLTPAAD
jgi:hypothetical protein